MHPHQVRPQSPADSWPSCADLGRSQPLGEGPLGRPMSPGGEVGTHFPEFPLSETLPYRHGDCG
eukprot:12537666-Alexandrium_andersonii.AAC.1